VIQRGFIPAGFDAERYRVSVAELERLTGLDFGSVIRAASLVSRVQDLGSADEATRLATGAQIYAALNDASVPISGRRALAQALVDMAQTESMRGLSADGRINLVRALGWVPSELWSGDDALPLLAGARRAIGDLEIRAAAGEMEIGPQTRAEIDSLKPKLLIGSFEQTVYLQFAIWPREEADAISAKLKSIGWDTPGEDREEAATGLHEVRFNPGVDEDRRAAELLAADLRAAGNSAVTARPVKIIAAGTLEIWISP
jgi:hypothetical protein